MNEGTTRTSADNRTIFDELERRLKALLPEEYQERYDDIQPVSMGSAGVRYGADGRIAWDQMWGSFCDLAMAGGPPHKGTLLRPGSPSEINANRRRYDDVVAEICRGVAMVTELSATPSRSPGWVRVECLTRGMAAWLLRAISMENVAVRADHAFLELPASPGYAELKEIKNVITVIAKTTHYWLGHMPVVQRQAIANLIEGMNDESPLVEPVYDAEEAVDTALERLSLRVGGAIEQETGLRLSAHRYGDWLGIHCPTVRTAVWMMRMMLTVNVLSRREGSVLFLPINPATDPDGDIVISSLTLVHSLALARRVL